ncbi:MAG: sigma-70 family RNA polymerase sigma factor [Planctomycetes bacterium]|nr:sigma-70 family RNA polymerase sigma factor [Planctomycetota bacterium]
MPAADADPEFEPMLAAARAGDAAALEAVLLATESRLRAYVELRLGADLRTRLRNSDVLQNAYVEMLDALPGFAGNTRDDFVSWVTRIIENGILRQRRFFDAKKRVQPRTSERNALARILNEPPPTPSAEVACSEKRQQVHRALARLEPAHADIIRLALLDELPHREVAARLGRSEGACRMLLLRARAALALELEQLGLDELREA